MDDKIDPRIREFGTELQQKYFDAYMEHKSQSKAAKALGVTRQRISDVISILKKKMSRAPEYAADIALQRGIPDGLKISGLSTYHKNERQWVKLKADTEKQNELARIVIKEMMNEIGSLSPIIEEPAHTYSDLLAVYPVGDPHIGMQAWAKETGDNFDLKIARELTLGAIDRLVSISPPAETAIFLPLGDVFHANDQSNRTPGHSHQLDVDSRHVKVLGIGIEIFKHGILRLLEKHTKVVVRFLRGNHDPEAVWVLSYALNAWFSNDPRVEVDLSPADQWYYRFGSVLLGATHGDRAKGSQLMGAMAVDRASDWGLTKHRYWLCGHVHHSSLSEFAGCTVETFRTLAAADAYAAGYGYRAGRDMRCIIYHKDHGEIERYRADVSLIRSDHGREEDKADNTE